MLCERKTFGPLERHPRPATGKSLDANEQSRMMQLLVMYGTPCYVKPYGRAHMQVPTADKPGDGEDVL